MLECTTEQAFGKYRWTFDRMLPSLPLPGTAIFPTIVQSLQPFGISPSGISIEAPTSLLGDVSLRISLLEGERAVVRISYSAFELTIDYLSEGDDKALPRILTTIFHALAEVDRDSQLGRAHLTWRAHLSLSSTQPSSFLGEHIKAPANQERLLPDVLYYNVVPAEDIKAAKTRIGLTRSLVFDNALFVEVVAEYKGLPQPESIGETFAEHAKIALELVGLNVKSKGAK